MANDVEYIDAGEVTCGRCSRSFRARDERVHVRERRHLSARSYSEGFAGVWHRWCFEETTAAYREEMALRALSHQLVMTRRG